VLVQLPTVRRVAPGVRAGLGLASPHVRTVLRSFGPVLVGRGVVQISGYIDNSLASLVAPGAVTVFTNAQMLYLLPGSLFGMSVSAAALPAMSSYRGAESEVAAQLRATLTANLRRIAFFVVPSAVAFLALGDVLAGAVFRYGRFTEADVLWVWATLAGAALGLLPSTLGRLYASAFYALHDTRSPLRFAVVRVALTLLLGYVAAVQLPEALGVERRWGTVGLTLASGLAGWVEFALLRRALGARVGRTGVPASAVWRQTVSAIAAAGAGWGAKLLLAGAPPLVLAAAVCAVFGAVYLGLTTALGEGEAAAQQAHLELELMGKGELVADVDIGGQVSRLTDELVLPPQRLVLDGAVRLTRVEGGYRVRAERAPERVAIEVRSRLIDQIASLCEGASLLALGALDCAPLTRALERPSVPLPAAGGEYFLADTELTDADRGELDALIAAPAPR
jgi:hypothetical protein